MSKWNIVGAGYCPPGRAIARPYDDLQSRSARPYDDPGRETTGYGHVVLFALLLAACLGLAGCAGGAGAYEGSVLKSFAISKAANAMKASTKRIKVKSSKVKKAKQKFKTAAAFKVNGAQGKVTYRKTSGSSKIAVSSNGTVTVKKGTAKGTYKVKIAVSAAGDANYGATKKVVKLTIKVK